MSYVGWGEGGEGGDASPVFFVFSLHIANGSKTDIEHEVSAVYLTKNP